MKGIREKLREIEKVVIQTGIITNDQAANMSNLEFIRLLSDRYETLPNVKKYEY